MCVESNESGVTVDNVDVKDTYLGVYHSQNSRAAKIRTDVDFKGRIKSLGAEVTNNILTTSSNFTPTVSSTHIISNSTHYHGIAYQGEGFSISSLNDDGKTTGSMAVHEITHEIGYVWDEYGSRTDFANVDSSTNNTADTVKWRKLLGFGGTGIASGDYTSVIIPVNACLMRSLGNYGYGLDAGGWGLCEVCRLEVARRLLSANDVRSQMSIYVAYPEVTKSHDAVTTYPYSMNLFRIRDKSVGVYSANMRDCKNSTIEFRTVVQNVDVKSDRKLTLKLTTYDSSGNVKQTAQNTTTISNYGLKDEEYRDINDRVSCQSLSIALQCDSTYDGSETILGEVIDAESGECLASDKDIWNSYEQCELQIKYIDKDSGNEIQDAGGASLFLKKDEEFSVSHPASVCGYTYVSNDSVDEKIKMDESVKTLTYYFTKTSEPAPQPDPTPEVCTHDGEKTHVVTRVATCVETGLEDIKCEKCGEVIESGVTTAVNSNNHKSLIEVEAKASTCLDAGYSAHKHCNDCGVDIDKTEIPAKDHVLETVSVDPTCTQAGSRITTCKNCDYKNIEAIAQLDHTVVKEADVKSTCSTHGHIGKEICSVCQTIITPEVELELDPDKHTNKLSVAGKAATCLEAGYSAYEHCNDCGVDFGKSEIPAKGHELETVSVDPTCTQVGSRTTTCKNCDYSNIETIAQLDHSFVSGVCIICGAKDSSYVDPEPLPTTFSLNIKSGSGITVTPDNSKYTEGQSAKVTISGSTLGNNLVVPSALKVDGVVVKTRDQLLDKSTWQTPNDIYKRVMNEDAQIVKFDTVANYLFAGMTVEISNVKPTTQVEVTAEELVPVYRLYNTITSEHLFTTNKIEYDDFVKQSETNSDYWIGEGINWFSACTSTQVVRRLYNPALGAMGCSSHYYSSSESEINNLINNFGWQDDGEANQFNSYGNVAIWTCYNEGLGSAHHYTSSKSEWLGLKNHGWDIEESKNGSSGVFRGMMSSLS